jgi:hypothetical protein
MLKNPSKSLAFKKCVQKRVQQMSNRTLPTKRCAAIDPDFIYAYTSSICNSNNLQEVRRCVECLQIPPYEDQVKIMQVIRELSRSIDITIIQGPIMNLLVENKIDQVNEILGALREYQEAASTLKDMAIAAMPEICLHLDVI